MRHYIKQFMCLAHFAYMSTRALAIATTTFGKISPLRFDWCPYPVQSSHFGTSRGKVVEFGFTTANCICLKVSKDFSTNPFARITWYFLSTRLSLNLARKLNWNQNYMFEAMHIRHPYKIVQKKEKKCKDCTCKLYLRALKFWN